MFSRIPLSIVLFILNTFHHTHYGEYNFHHLLFLLMVVKNARHYQM